MPRTSLTALTLAATALAAAGCGGSSKPNASTASSAATSTAATTTTAPAPTPTTTIKLATGKPLTRAQWIARGDAICARANTKIAAISAKSVSEYGRLLPQVVAYYSTEAIDLSKLVPPASMSGDAARIVNGIQSLSEYLNRSAHEFQAGNNRAGSQLFNMAIVAQKQPIAVAKRDGFKKCTATN